MVSRFVVCILLLSSVMITCSIEKAKKKLINDFFDIEVIKFGDFVLKSGMISPIYIDLRKIISHPRIMKEIARQFKNNVDLNSFDCICGVPYAALPMATVFSLITDKPMLMRRKEAKDYGTKRMIEGDYKPGLRCLVVEDCFTTGGSALETIKALESEGLVVEQIVIVVDRQQGGKECVERNGYIVKEIFKLSEIVEELEYEGLISSRDATVTKSFIEQYRIG